MALKGSAVEAVGELNNQQTVGDLPRPPSKFYDQRSRRGHRIYLFRGEYIFDLPKAVVVETPQLGHATYLFAKRRSMESFLALYTRIPKEDIRHNRDNVA